METIDSSRMQVFDEFDAVDEVVDQTERYRVGALGETVVVNTYTRGGGWAGGLFFERANLPEVIRALGGALGGRLAAEGLTHLSVNRGRDVFSVRDFETHDRKVRIQLVNNRPARFDRIELQGWSVAMTPGTAARLLEALGRAQVHS